MLKIEGLFSNDTSPTMWVTCCGKKGPCVPSINSKTPPSAKFNWIPHFAGVDVLQGGGGVTQHNFRALAHLPAEHDWHGGGSDDALRSGPAAAPTNALSPTNKHPAHVITRYLAPLPHNLDWARVNTGVCVAVQTQWSCSISFTAMPIVVAMQTQVLIERSVTQMVKMQMGDRLCEEYT